MVLLTFAVSDHFQEESGLVAVTVLGLVLANQTYVDIDAVLEFAQSLQVLVLSSLFLLLAPRLDFDVVRADLAGNLLLLVVSVLVARPLRSEERRVGKACVSTCTSRWSTGPSKTN